MVYYTKQLQSDKNKPMFALFYFFDPAIATDAHWQYF